MNYPPNIEEIRKFAEYFHIDVKYLLGELCDGDLWLSYVVFLPPIIVFNVGGNLSLNSVKVLPKNIVFNVGGDLFLRSVENVHSSVQFVNYKILFLPFDEVKVKWT